MRLAILTREFLPQTRWGGIGTFYADFVRSLSGAGVDAEVFTQSLEIPFRERIDGVLVHGCVPRVYAVGPRRGGALGGMAPHALGSFSLSLAAELARRLERRHAERPFDIVESHEHLGVGSLLRVGTGWPKQVVRYHTAYDLLVRRGLEPWPRSRMIRWLEGRALRRAEIRVAPSVFIERETHAHFRSVPRADHVIPLPCRFERTEPPPVGRKEPLVVFVGRLQERKQPLVAARSFARIAAAQPKWRLVYAGADAALPNGSSASQACREALGPFADRSEFLGPLEADDLVKLFARAAVCIVPSTFESFGLVALEAMNLGCVPVVSAGHALQEVVGNAGCISPVGDVEGFAAHLARLLASPAERDERSRRSIGRARQEFGAAGILRRNLAVFETLAEQGSK